ncbi:hypothetical protein FHR33_000553 [Nonomuraea dietziae]|uniref:Uncharacterized protein n=1 Tax=Nonomuraea dietziae TaxID=65515 RepID=A0A7W5V1A0_9ACTN|nr:hypothetical protein [Nonomuraea dietziae]
MTPSLYGSASMIHQFSADDEAGVRSTTAG